MFWRSLKQIEFAFIGIILGWCFTTTAALGDISLPKIFSDHMVVQQSATINVCGTAEPGQKLAVRFAGQEFKVTADAKGNWNCKIKTGVAGGPYELEVADVEGEPKVMFSDVWIGEVWICSGQAAMKVSQALNSKTEVDQSKNFPNLRLFTVGQFASAEPLNDFAKATAWSVCSPETVKDFSATAYFFGRELSKELTDVKIGLIDASWEGTVCEAWTSRAAMEKVDALKPLLKHSDENDDPNSPNRVANLFNGMIAPLRETPFRGAIWYQGEANNGRGHQYATLFSTLIKDWRQQFGIGDFPFYFVQLAPYRYKLESNESLAEVRDAQLKTLKTVVNTGMVVTTDIGNVEEISPKNKQSVGRRLALIALAKIYKALLPEEKQSISFSGPIYESMKVEGNTIRIKFSHAQGLQIRSNDGESLTGFSICGKDQKFVAAEAKIDGETVVVSSPEVAEPVHVRFAWDDTAQPNLINQGPPPLPASPFRTDGFPLQSEGRDF